MTLWHEKQDTVPVDEKRGSKYSILPSSTLDAVVGLSAGAGAVSGNDRHGVCAAAGPLPKATATASSSSVSFLMRISRLHRDQAGPPTVSASLLKPRLRPAAMIRHGGRRRAYAAAGERPSDAPPPAPAP